MTSTETNCERCGWPRTPVPGCNLCAVCCGKYHNRDYDIAQCTEKKEESNG